MTLQYHATSIAYRADRRAIRAPSNSLDRAADRLMPELRDLQRAQDGTEIKSRELELVTDRAQNLTHRRDAFEIMRDDDAEAYRADTGDTWLLFGAGVGRRSA